MLVSEDVSQTKFFNSSDYLTSEFSLVVSGITVVEVVELREESYIPVTNSDDVFAGVEDFFVKEGKVVSM